MSDDEIPAASRSTFLLVSEVKLLHGWGRELRAVFDTTPYLVGSVLHRKDYRDVDVRIMLDDKHHKKLAKVIDLDLLNLMLSLWGQKVTGLPIDCQVQQRFSANEDFKGRRHPIGREVIR